MRNCSPPDERRPQGPQTHRQTLIMSSLSCISGTKLSQHAPASSPTGTKLSQHTHKRPFQPVLPEQGELCTARTTTTPSRENFVPLAPPRPPAGRTLYRTQRQTRYKTLPTRPRSTAVPRKSSPSTPHTTTEPRKSSPSTPKNGVFRLFRVCRANFFAHRQATSHAGRIISHTGDRTGSADEGRMR